MKPDQFGLSLAALLNIHPECQRRLEYISDGRMCGTFSCRSGLYMTEAKPFSGKLVYWKSGIPYLSPTH